MGGMHTARNRKGGQRDPGSATSLCTVIGSAACTVSVEYASNPKKTLLASFCFKYGNPEPSN